jgi:hypothetical protein
VEGGRKRRHKGRGEGWLEEEPQVERVSGEEGMKLPRK